MAATLAQLGVNFGEQGPNLGPTCTHLTQTSPQLGSKMAQLQLGPGATSAQAEVHMAKDGQVWPQSALVGKHARSFPLYPILWVRAALVVKRLE